MVDAVHEALRKDGRAMCTSGTGEDDGSAGKEWWTKLCANKHLTEDTKLKRVRNAMSFSTYIANPARVDCVCGPPPCCWRIA